MATSQTRPGAPSGPGRRLRRAWDALASEQRLAALAGLALWASMFLPWYSKSVVESVGGSPRAAGYSLSAFGAFSFVEAAVLLVASSVLVLLFARAERRAFHLPGGDGSVILVAGVWTGLLVFYRMLDKPATTGNAQLTTVIGLQWGIFVAMAGAVGLAYAGSRLRGAHRPEPARSEDPTIRRPHPAPAPPPPGPPPADEDATRVVPGGDADPVDGRPPRAGPPAAEETEQLAFDPDPPVEPRTRRAPPPAPGARRPPGGARRPDPFDQSRLDPFGEPGPDPFGEREPDPFGERRPDRPGERRPERPGEH
ncbi:MAG: hypothetical protein QOF77_1482 [Solirubrobacteraceae bacterium]|nr:hypothetical protein [Solirubrobacteraceae bacterium]